MKKVKLALVIILAALVVSVSIGSVFIAFADTANESEAITEETVDPNISANESSLEELVDGFTEYLKSKYGADYEFYYNQIIEQWGSIEGYLLSFGSKLPDEYQSGWEKFIHWLGEYAPVWAPALAVVILILVAVIGKKQFNKLIDRIVNGKLSPIVQELNAQSKATVAILRSQKALLPKDERFAENVKELEESEKELKGE